MLSVRKLVLGALILGPLACTLGLHPWVSRAEADGSTAACPGAGDINKGCVCWSDDGILKMVCRDVPDTTRASGKEGNGAGGTALTTTSASPPRQAAVASPSAAKPQKFTTSEDRRAYFERQQESLDDKLLEIQRARFLARARNEKPEELERLDDAFAKLQGSRHQNLTELQAFETND